MLRQALGSWGASTLLLACGDPVSTTGDALTTSTGPSDTATDDSTTTRPTATVGPATGTGTGTATGDGSTTEEPSSTSLDDSTGTTPACGDGALDDGEVCDGRALAGSDCLSLGFTGGALSCLDDCSDYDTSACTQASCGDGLAEASEACDGDDLLGASCTSEGFDSGTLGCANDCSLDTSECGSCGNVIVDGDEACDDVALLGQTCELQGFEYGQIACASDCMGFETSGCGLCGDGSLGGAEACDGPDLGGASCMSLGLGNGNLACLPGCSFDFFDCDIQGLTEVVDFPVAADPRFVMFGVNPWNAGDWFEGVRATMLPSIGQIDIHLEIDSNVLSPCGVQEAEVSINGVPLGTFAVVQGTTAIDQSYPIMPSIMGPVYTIRYETTTTVAGGCGSAHYDEIGSTVTFHGG